MSHRIRLATPADTEAIGRVHAGAWHESYGAIMTPEILATAGSVAARTEKRRKIFACTTPRHGHFAVEDGEGVIVGFGDCGPALEVGDYASAEVTTLYLLRAAQGRGTGRALLMTMLKHLAEKGFPTAALKVFAENKKSQGFYEKCGGKKAGALEVEIAGKKFPTAVYLWDLKPFAPVENPGQKT